MNPIAFFVRGIPKPQPRARSFVLRGRGGRPILSRTGQPILRVHECGTAEEWKSRVAEAAGPFVPMPPLDGPLKVSIDFYFPRPANHFRANGQLKPNAPAWHRSRGDVDNLFKAVTDALTVIGMWDDDKQIADARVTKRYSDTPGAEIHIEQMVPAQMPEKLQPSLAI